MAERNVSVVSEWLNNASVNAAESAQMRVAAMSDLQARVADVAESQTVAIVQAMSVAQAVSVAKTMSSIAQTVSGITHTVSGISQTVSVAQTVSVTDSVSQSSWVSKSAIAQTVVVSVAESEHASLLSLLLLGSCLNSRGDNGHHNEGDQLCAEKIIYQQRFGNWQDAVL